MADNEEYEYEGEEEGEEIEDSSNPEQAQMQAQMGEPQTKNTNVISQPKAEDKKSANSKRSGGSKISKSKLSKHSGNKKKEPSINKNINNNTSTKKNNPKTSSLKNENAYKLPTPEQVVSTRSYLEQTVTSVIQEALLELARQRPDNPLEFVGNYILSKAKGKK